MNGIYHVTASTSDQDYTPYNAGLFPLISPAVDALFTGNKGTSGKIIKYNDSIIDAAYFGHNNGININSEDNSTSFGFYHPYLREKYTEGVDTSGGTQGHGVGLSQCGIRHFAKNGATYTNILQYYYQAQPAFIARMVILQDFNEDKQFSTNEIVYDGEWSIDNSDKLKMVLSQIKMKINRSNL